MFTLWICNAPLWAHEYWLDPVGSQWQAGDLLQADIRNGQDFAGTAYPFDPGSLARGGLISDSNRVALRGRPGDYPAFQLPVQEAGLHLLLLDTRQRQVIHDTLQEFAVFLGEHGLSEFIEQHQERALPETDILEYYFRYTKALVSVATSVDTDTKSRGSNSSDTLESEVAFPSTANEPLIPALQAQDQRLELLLSDTPFGSETMSVQVLFEGAPLSNRQLELFHRDSSGKVDKTLARSDDQGYAQFDISDGGDYLLNSVWIEVPRDGAAHWQTLWASLFFQQTETRDD